MDQTINDFLSFNPKKKKKMISFLLIKMKETYHIMQLIYQSNFANYLYLDKYEMFKFYNAAQFTSNHVKRSQR